MAVDICRSIRCRDPLGNGMQGMYLDGVLCLLPLDTSRPLRAVVLFQSEYLSTPSVSHCLSRSRDLNRCRVANMPRRPGVSTDTPAMRHEVLRLQILVLLGLGALILTSKQLGLETFGYYCFLLSGGVLGSTALVSVVYLFQWLYGMRSEEEYSGS